MNKNTLVGIIQGFFLLAGAWWGYADYFGRIKFAGEAEVRRLKKVEKYGPILMLGVVLCLLSGLGLIAINAYDWFIR